MEDGRRRSGRRQLLSEKKALALQTDAELAEEKSLEIAQHQAKAAEKEARRAEKAAQKARADAARQELEAAKVAHGIKETLISTLEKQEKEAAKKEKREKALEEKEEKERKARLKEVTAWLEPLLRRVVKMGEDDELLRPPSAASGGATHSHDAMLGLLVASAEAVVDGRDAAFCEKVTPSYAPLLSDPASAEALAFATAARTVLHDAYAAAKALGPKRASDAEMLFEQRAWSRACSPAVRELSSTFLALQPEVPERRGVAAFASLWRVVVDEFKSRNAPAPSTAPTAASEEGETLAPLLPSALARDVFAYMAGWGLFRLRQRAVPAHAAAVAALIAPGGRLGEDEPALAYLQAREVFGNLTHPSRATIKAMSIVGSLLEEQLSEERLGELGPGPVFNGARTLIQDDARVKAAFREAFAAAGGGPYEAEGEVVLQLLELVFLSSAKQMRNQWRKATKTARSEGSLAIRSKLKAEVLKEVRKEVPVIFSGKSISADLSEKSLHMLLCIVNEEAPELLATVSARQLRGVLGAYAASDDTLEPSLRKKEPSKEPLVAAVRAAIAHRADAGFARYDQLVFSK